MRGGITSCDKGNEPQLSLQQQNDRSITYKCKILTVFIQVADKPGLINRFELFYTDVQKAAGADISPFEVKRYLRYLIVPWLQWI